MKKLFIIFGLLSLVVSACKKVTIDKIAFYNEKLTAYHFDGYQGGWNFEAPASYTISQSNIHLFSLYSVDSDKQDSAKIYAVYVGDSTTITTDTIIVYCHGQSSHMDAYWQRAKLLANIGSKDRYGVLMMDYRGYGMSEGEPTEQGLYRDVESCLDWLKNQGVSNQNVIVYGYSLGTVPAVEVAANYDAFKPSKLILESPLASADNLSEESTLIGVSSEFLSTLQFDNVDKIKRVTQPFLWMHGIEDDYINISNGELVYQNYGGTQSTAVRVPGANHGNVPLIMGFNNYNDTLYNFILK